MVLPEQGCLLRIFIGESDRHSGKPLYEWIVLKAREQGLAGATVLRGMMGYGAHSRLHTFKIEPVTPPRGCCRDKQRSRTEGGT
jgi:PII-like signaling protein